MADLRALAGLSAIVFCAAAWAQKPTDAALLAQSAYYALEAEPFKPNVAGEAARNVQRAAQAAPREPWVLIAQSQLALTEGYVRGDRSKQSSYRPQDLASARELAQQAVQAGPEVSMAHVQLARIRIIEGEHRIAWEGLNSAHRLDPDNFYPWYYRGVIALQMNDAKRAAEAFDAAAAKARLPHQKRWAAGRGKDVARLTGDVEGEERAYQQAISMNPTSAQAYGNYGTFLKRHKRYDEAIEQFRKAVEISPYPLAVEQLKLTTQLRDAAKGQGGNKQ